MTFTELARRYPPVLCRLLAMRGGSGGVSFVHTNAEIRQRSGLTQYEVESISGLVTWERVPFGLMQKFLAGCGLDFEDWRKMRKFHEFMKRVGDRNRGWGHLRRSPEWLCYYEPLLKIYARSLK